MTSILSLLSLVLTVAKGYFLRVDREKLINSGKLETLYLATRELEETLAAVRKVDAAIIDDELDPAWIERVRKRAGSDSLG